MEHAEQQSNSQSRIRRLPVYASVLITAIVGLLHYQFATGIAPQFEDVFAGYGTDLPWLTQLVFAEPWYYWGFPIFIALCFVAHHLDYLSRPIVLLICSVGTFASLMLIMFGLYLPIFQLGAVVG